MTTIEAYRAGLKAASEVVLQELSDDLGPEVAASILALPVPDMPTVPILPGPPTEPGIFWRRAHKNAEWLPRRVVRSEETGNLICQYTFGEVLRIGKVGGEWAGPIPLPPDEPTEESR